MLYIMEIIKYCKPLFIFTGTLISLSSIHWLLVLIYHYYCLDRTVYGIITNMVYMGNPICASINKIQSILLDQYLLYISAGLITLTTWISNVINI